MIELVAGAALAGITSFFATNIDDILVLMILFGRVDYRLRDHHIFLGRYLGFSVIILASLLGFWCGLFLPKPVIGLLGLLPIWIGYTQLKDHQNQATDRGSDDDSILAAEVSPGTSGARPENQNDQYQNDQYRGLGAVGWPRSITKPLWLGWLSPPVAQVAGITIACGGDNIGIYVPLFATSNPPQLAIILIVFFVAVGLLCFLARYLSRHRAIAQVIRRFGQQFTPWVLMGLGVWILLDSDLLSWTGLHWGH